MIRKEAAISTNRTNSQAAISTNRFKKAPPSAPPPPTPNPHAQQTQTTLHRRCRSLFQKTKVYALQSCRMLGLERRKLSPRRKMHFCPQISFPNAHQSTSPSAPIFTPFPKAFSTVQILPGWELPAWRCLSLSTRSAHPNSL